MAARIVEAGDSTVLVPNQNEILPCHRNAPYRHDRLVIRATDVNPISPPDQLLLPFEPGRIVIGYGGKRWLAAAEQGGRQMERRGLIHARLHRSEVRGWVRSTP